MLLKTRLYEYQSKAVDKLSKLKVGALYMEQGTGKTRTALEIIKNKMSKGKVEVVLWLCPCSVKNNLKEDIIKHTGELPTENNIIIRGIESLSSSDRLYLQLLELVKIYKVYLIVDESNLVKNKLANKQCGAYGLNLQFCHNIIFYSNDFDLATRLQAEDRVHRIGQDKIVNIYDICCKYTIDVFIANCLQNKTNLLDSFKKQIAIWKEATIMEELTIRQMSSATDKDFYSILGYFFASKKFRKELEGYPLSNEDDWIWFVAFNKDNNVIGFLSLEPMTSGYKIDSIYVLLDYHKIYGNRVYNELIEKAVKLSQNNKKYLSGTVRKDLVIVFEKYDFYITKNKSEKWINIRRDVTDENIQK